MKKVILIFLFFIVAILLLVEINDLFVYDKPTNTIHLEGESFNMSYNYGEFSVSPEVKALILPTSIILMIMILGLIPVLIVMGQIIDNEKKYALGEQDE